MRILKTHWPLIAAVGVLWAALAFALAVVYRSTGGQLIYALDDPYIHMSVAKNFAEYGVWGVTRYEFSSSTSSILWPLLLTLDYKVFGVNDVSAFTLNVLFATLTLVACYYFLRERGLKRPLWMLLGVAFFTPLPALVFTGMEHTLQTLAILMFIVIAARDIAQPRRHGRTWLAFWALVVCLTRYESAFAVLIVCLLLFMHRRFVDGAVVGVMGLAPIVGYGLIALSQGWYFLPNPLYIKVSDFTVDAKLSLMVYTLVTTPYLWCLIIVAALLVIRRRMQPQTATTVMLVIFMATTMLHLVFARTGWFYRYEAYLVALGLLAVSAALAEHPLQFARRPGRLGFAGLSVAILAGVVFIPTLAARGVFSFQETPRAVKNIYDQQYQMGLFLRAFYQGSRVVANDIGAINYLADIHNLDIYGLGSLDVLAARRAGRFDAAAISHLAADQEIAIVYDEWIAPEGIIPPGWEQVGQWTIQDNVIAAYPTVTFYAIQPSARETLRLNLRAFSARLPSDVAEAGDYLVASP